ncbi:MAG: VOC family protein [Bacteroidota bacterium]
MQQHIAQMALVVRDYDEAIVWFRDKLNFRLIEDTPLTPEKRWVLIAPPGQNECRLLLARAANERQREAIGNQSGGRVFMFLFTDDFWRDYHAMTAKGVTWERPPKEESYGTVAVFEDLYGNLWDLIEPSQD